MILRASPTLCHIVWYTYVEEAVEPVLRHCLDDNDNDEDERNKKEEEEE